MKEYSVAEISDEFQRNRLPICQGLEESHRAKTQIAGRWYILEVEIVVVETATEWYGKGCV